MSKADTTQIFIEKAKRVHNNFYSYDLSNYINSHTKVIITCPNHGDFLQQPNNHIAGSGCLLCSWNKISLDNLLSQEEFVNKANLIHFGRYDYSATEYLGHVNPININCNIHGTFSALARSHLSGKGCPSCKTISVGANSVREFLIKNKIVFKTEKTFSGLKSKYGAYLRLDFYLPEMNTVIEFDGDQHFIPVPFWGGEEGLKNIQENDHRKNQYCLDRSIKMIRVNNKDAIWDILGTLLLNQSE